MSSAIDDAFKGMADAEIYSGGSYFDKEGIFRVKLKDLFFKNGTKGKAAIAEFEVLESNNPEVAVGETKAVVCKLEGEWAKLALANLADLMIALLGYENTAANKKDPAIRLEGELVARAVCGSETAIKELGPKYTEGMLKGIEVKLEAVNVPTKPSIRNNMQGGTRTRHVWEPVAA